MKPRTRSQRRKVRNTLRNRTRRINRACKTRRCKRRGQTGG